MKNITFAYLEKQKISAGMGTLYEPSALRKVRMHFPKVQDGQQKNEKIVKFVTKIQNQIVRPDKF